jgi:signal transduction histidine kinase
MQQTQRTTEWDGTGRRHTQSVVERLAASRGAAETLAEVAHDARNMVTALGLYCDLLEEPGVLTAPYVHYGSELRLVAAASRRLVEKLLVLDGRANSGSAALPGGMGAPVKPPVSVGADERARTSRRWEPMPAMPIDSLAGELLANRNLLAALAGPTVALAVDSEGAALPVRLTGEDLTRVLVNLVKNAAEAMPAGGAIQLTLRRQQAEPGRPEALVLFVDDSGPGVPPQTLEEIFTAGFTTQRNSLSSTGWPSAHRGLGLSITRSIIEAAGGQIAAENRTPTGARFRIELPVHRR